MNILFVTWAGGGNSTPVLGLSTRLHARGHAVTVVSPDGGGERFAAVGVAHGPLGSRPRAVLDAILEARPDVVVVDYMMPSWMSQAEASGMPWIALVHTLHDRAAAGILMAFTTLEAVNEERAELGLDTLGGDVEILDRAFRVLVTSPQELDTSTDVPDNVRFVGAILEEPGDTEWTSPWPDDLLVVVSLGTTGGLDDHIVLPRVLAAIEPLPVGAIVNASAHLDVSTLAPPANALIEGYVRHAAVMPHAAVVVSHGGLGTTLAALSFGVPLVSIPLGRDQPHNAARVEAVGAGVALDLDAPPDAIRDAIVTVITDPSYREAATRFAAMYDATASAAIAEIESAG